MKSNSDLNSYDDSPFVADVPNVERKPVFREPHQITIPSFYLPKDLRKLQTEIAQMRFELNQRNREFRRRLSDWLSTLKS